MDVKTRVDVNCERKGGRTENRMPVSHLAKADATKIVKRVMNSIAEEKVGRLTLSSVAHLCFLYAYVKEVILSMKTYGLF